MLNPTKYSPTYGLFCCQKEMIMVLLADNIIMISIKTAVRGDDNMVADKLGEFG